MKISKIFKEAANHLTVFEKEMRESVRRVDQAMELIDIARNAFDKGRILIEPKTVVKVKSVKKNA